jgi:hypothetical protein
MIVVIGINYQKNKLMIINYQSSQWVMQIEPFKRLKCVKMNLSLISTRIEIG